MCACLYLVEFMEKELNLFELFNRKPIDNLSNNPSEQNHKLKVCTDLIWNPIKCV